MCGWANYRIQPQKKRAGLRYLMYITKKKTGKIKARGCADGRNKEILSEKWGFFSYSSDRVSIFIVRSRRRREEECSSKGCTTSVSTCRHGRRNLHVPYWKNGRVTGESEIRAIQKIHRRPQRKKIPLCTSMQSIVWMPQVWTTFFEAFT